MNVSVIAARLGELKDRFLGGSDERLAILTRILERIAACPGDADAREELQRGLHSLAGLAGTHGFQTIRQIVREVEIECRNWPARWADDLGFVRHALQRLRVEFREAAGNDAPAESSEDQTPAILVVLGVDGPAKELETELVAEGFRVQIASTAREALELIVRQRPDGVIVESSLGDGSGLELIERFRCSSGRSIAPAIVVGTKRDFMEKVAALRSGADVYLEAGHGPREATSRMRDLFAARAAGDARILSVEDDPDQAEIIRTVLESAGYQVRVCEDPSQFEQDLRNFRPDLILMDIVLPRVSGYDLARVVRHEEAYATLPILFLTTVSQARMETISAGGDDHLIKPIAPKMLLMAVAQRLRRSRSVQRLIDRDGLTGLLTHAAFLLKAREVLAKQNRVSPRSAALVMLDVDHFKSVNDSRGHAAGDQVLASLGHLLRRRVRSDDIVGRYGGEEFALLLPDVTRENAELLISRILTEFSASAPRLPDGSAFYLSFSAGLAMLESGMNLQTWKKAADDALYGAKHAGRNRMRVA